MNMTTDKTLPRSHLDTITLDNTKKQIDTFLADLLRERVAQAEIMNTDYAQLWSSIATLVQAGGKRLRPYMIFLAYTMDGKTNGTQSIVPAAAAQELLHMAMLIHDDIIDRDQVRYGVKNIIGQYDALYEPYVNNSTERRHFSNSAAILAGDLLIAEAYSLIQQCDVDAAHVAKAQAVLSESIFRVVGGELLDTESAFRPFESVSALQIAQQKTASYSFVGPLIMGASLADASTKTIDGLWRFGSALGIAYQLQDDLLGAFGVETITGKSNSSDIVEGKHTHLIEQFYRLADSEQISEFNTIFNNNQADHAAIERARQLLIQSGASRAVEAAIDELAGQAKSHLDELTMAPTSRAAFAELIERCVKRAK